MIILALFTSRGLYQIIERKITRKPFWLKKKEDILNNLTFRQFHEHPV